MAVHDNTVISCAVTQGSGCYHLADPRNGTYDVGDDAQTTIYNETMELETGGVGFWLRDGYGWTVRDITVVRTHGQIGQLDSPVQSPPGGPVPTSPTFP